MATLGDLKARIISETLRDDLADDMAVQFIGLIQKSIDQYAANRWWFNEASAVSPTVVGSPYVTLPQGFRYLDQAWLQVGGVSFPLRLVQAVEIDELYAESQANAQPTVVAVLGPNFYLWPSPSQVWNVRSRYVADVQPPLDYSNENSSNFWTNEGQDLIVARVKLRLYRDYLSATLQDPRVMGANNQEQEAYSRLRSEHNRRLTTNHIRAGW